MHTFSIDLHFFTSILELQKLVFAILYDNNCLLNLWDKYRDLIEKKPIDEFGRSGEMLKFMVSIEENVFIVVKSQVKDKTFVYQIVDIAWRPYDHVFDTSLHE